MTSTGTRAGLLRTAAHRVPRAVLVGAALASHRRAPGRALLGATVAALAVVLLLASLSMGSVAGARAAREAARQPVPGVAPGTGDALLYESATGWFEGHEIAAQWVAVRGRTALLPAGLGSLPGPGELAVSPEMARLIADPTTSLHERYPGRVTQVVAPEGLLGPSELVVWTGADPGRMSSRAIAVLGFGGPGRSELRLPAELRPAQALLAVGFLLPLLALLVTCATVGGAQRDRRLSALRLLGLTARDVRGVTAVETGTLAVAGVLGGLGLFAALRQVVPLHLPLEGGVEPADVQVGWPVVAGLLVLVPALAVLAAAASLRSVSVEPLAVVRRAPRGAPRAARLLPLVAGAVLLCLASVAGLVGDGAVTPRAVAVVVGVGSCALGLLLGSSVVGHRLARRLERRAGSLPVVLGLRQARESAVRSARAVTGLACMVFVSGLLLCFFPLLSDATAQQREHLTTEAGSSLLVARLGPGDQVADRELQVAPAIGAAAVLRQVSLQAGDGSVATVLVGPCAEVRLLVPLPDRGCAGGASLDGSTVAGPVRLVEPVVGADGLTTVTPVGPPFPVAAPPGVSALLAALSEGNGLSSSAYLPTELLPAEAAAALPRLQGLVVARAAGDARLEEARTAVVRATGGSSTLTTGESLAIAQKDTRTFRGLTAVAFVSGLVVAGLSLFVATADQVREQRRVWQELWVLGCPDVVARRALWTQVAVTTVPVLLLSSALSLLAGHAFVTLADAPPALPWAQLAATSAGALVAPAVSTLVVRRRLRPGLRPPLSPGS